MERAFRHFDIDLAASDTNTRAETYYTGPCVVPDECHCGLHDSQMNFRGLNVWCNPPYGKGIERWVWRFSELRDKGADVVALLPANTDTRWWQLLAHLADAIYLLVGRVQFKGTTSSNPSGSAIAVFRHSGPPRWLDGADIVMWDWRAEIRHEASPVVAGHR